MRSRTAKWFETKVKYEKLMENGLLKSVTEPYVVDALSFSETETKIFEEMSAYLSGDMQITDIKPATYKEIFFSDVDTDDKWYKAKLQFITIDEKTEKLKQTEIPIYKGGLIKELAFEEVVSNSAAQIGNNNQVLGTLAGKGTMTGKHKGGKVIIKVDEPCYIMGIISITPRIDYSQGNTFDVNLKTLEIIS